MGDEIGQGPVKLVISIIYRDRAMLDRAEKVLRRMYGPREDLVIDLPFDYTDYYAAEFGSPLFRRVSCFRRHTSPEHLAEIKRATDRLEHKLGRGGRRTVNIDPGYVTAAKLVLLTTKDYTHRVYIGRCIFAESTLYYRDGSFRAWPWTYPDYASVPMVEYFNKVRRLYLEEARGRKKGPKP